MNNKKIYFIFDNSGSIGLKEKDVYEQILEHYTENCSNYEIIEHNTQAKKVLSERTFFGTYGEGGTYISNAFKLIAGDLLLEKNPENVTIVFVGDGDNWSEDNDYLFKVIERLLYLKFNIVYHEIKYKPQKTTLINLLKKNISMQFNKYIITKDTDIFGKENKMKDIALYSVEFKKGGKKYIFISKEDIEVNEMVVCDTTQGQTYGKVVSKATAYMYEAEANKKYKKISRID